MNRYKLSYVMYDPSESTEDDKYMAEIPALPGCRVWGDTPAETLHILQGVAEAFIQSYLNRRNELPPGVVGTPVEHSPAGEMTVIA